jgi:hypothetical protein
MNSRAWMIRILAALLAVGIALSLAEACRTRDWWGALLNLGPELIGAVVTYALFEVFIGSKAKEEEQKRRLIEEAEKEKARLIQEMGSKIRDVAVAAAEKLDQRGWLRDGSVRQVVLMDANLEGMAALHADLWNAYLINVNLQHAFLPAANLQAAFLGRTKLQGAYLVDANLLGAYVRTTEFDEETGLPDSTKWTPNTDMARFTDPEHPDFWRSDNPHSPAYRGDEG